MTFRQEKTLQKVREQIKAVRQLLDDVMYHDEPLSDKEFGRVRSAYDSICKANDQLP